MKGNNDKELKIIKDFITKINNGKNNKSNAGSKFKKLKQKVNNDKLKHDLVKHLKKVYLEQILKVLNQKKNTKKV